MSGLKLTPACLTALLNASQDGILRTWCAPSVIERLSAHDMIVRVPAVTSTDARLILGNQRDAYMLDAQEKLKCAGTEGDVAIDRAIELARRDLSMAKMKSEELLRTVWRVTEVGQNWKESQLAKGR